MSLPTSKPRFVTTSEWNAISAGGRLSAKKEAIKDALEFMTRTSQPKFPHFPRPLIAEGLCKRVNDPSKIDQQMANLCGPAVLLHNRANQKPVDYVRFVTELYENGKSNFGSLNVKAESHVRKHDPRNHARNGHYVHPVDWIPLGSLRDSENKVLKYDSVNDGIVRAGTRSGELKNWLRKVGYTKVIDSTSYGFHKDEKHLRRADTLYRSNYRVFLLIDGRMFSTKPTAAKRGNHWVMLRSPITLQRQRLGPNRSKTSVSAKVFTWGQIKSVPSRMSISYFLLHYFGYVAAKFVAKS